MNQCRFVQLCNVVTGEYRVVASIQGDLTLSWRNASTGMDFGNSIALQAGANNQYTYEFADIQAADYDLKVSYINQDGQEVIVDWLRFNPTDDNLNASTQSVAVEQTEKGGRLAGTTVYAGFHTGQVSLNQISLNAAVIETDSSAGYIKRSGVDTGYYVENKYDALGNLIATNKDTGIWREYSVDAMGNQIKEVSKGTQSNSDVASYRVSYMQFDAMNREVSSWSAIDGKTISTHNVTSKEYDYAGNLVKETLEDGSYIEHVYNSVGLKTQETHFAKSGGILRRDTYDFNILGQETRTLDNLNYGTEKEYDDYGNVFREYTADKNSTSTTYKTYAYDAFGRRTHAYESMSGNNPSTKTTRYTYDKADRLTKIVEGLNNAAEHTTIFKLDSRGNRIMTTRPDAAGPGEIEIYDEMGRVITRITSHGKTRVTESKSYDIFGNLVGETDQMGRRSTKVYGEFGRLLQEQDQDGRLITYKYDEFGNQTHMIKSAKVLYQEGQGSYTSYKEGRYEILERIEIVKEYDAQNRLLKVSEYSSNLKSGGVNSWYDLWRIDWQFSPAMSLGLNTTYTYDATGERATEIVKDGSSTLREITYQHNALGELTRWEDTITGAHLNYSFDTSGRLVSVYTDKGQNEFGDNTLGSNEYHTKVDYTYNDLGQLHQVVNSSKGAASTETYEYYENGLTKKAFIGGSWYSYDYNGRGDVIRSDWNKDGKDHFAVWTYDEYGNTTQYEVTRTDVIQHAAQYHRGVKIKDAWTEYKNVQVQLDTNSYIYGTSLSSESTSKSEGDDGASTTTTEFDLSGRSTYTEIKSPGSRIWYDTIYSKGGTRLREVLDGDNVKNARTLTTQTYFEYDGNGKMIEFKKDKGTKDKRSEQRTFVYNNDGQILSRTIFDNTKESGQYDTQFHYADGEAVGETGQNDKGEAKSELGTGSYSPVQHLGEDFPTGSLSSFTATGGETLRQVAGMLLGNQNLWFVLAEANGLQANDTLSAGQTITIPNSVETAKFDSETHKVYSESEIIGNTMPNVRQKKKKKKCGSFLAIVITVVIAVVAVYLTAGVAAPFIAGALTTAGVVGVAGFAATVALTALAGAAIYAGLNIVQQGLMIAAGLQEGFDWGQVRDQARQGAISGALAGMGAYAKTLDAADKMKTVINVSKTALNVANKAYQQMEANDGKITNWTGLLMAAAPAVGDLGFEEAAGVIDAYGDYATPWLGLAEKALSGDDLTSEDYLMAVGNTLSTAIDANDSILSGELSKIGAKTLVAGAMYLNDKDAAGDYFKNMVGQEVGQYLSGVAGDFLKDQTKGLNLNSTGLNAALASVSAGISSYASTYVSSRMRGESSRDAFSMAYDGLQGSIQDAAVSQFADTGREKAKTADLFGMAANGIQSLYDDFTNTQRVNFGQIDNIEIVDSLQDGDAVAYGAFDSATGKIMISQELMSQAAAGDEKASAHLLGLIKEELTHREANIEEQKLNIGDYQFDEGALAARQMLKALGEHDGNTVFSFSIGEEGFDFSTSADAINTVIDENFGWGRILSDRQSGSLEFNSSNLLGQDRFRDLSSLNQMMDSMISGTENLTEILSILQAQEASALVERQALKDSLSQDYALLSDLEGKFANNSYFKMGDEGKGLHDLVLNYADGDAKDALLAALTNENGELNSSYGRDFGSKTKAALDNALTNLMGEWEGNFSTQKGGLTYTQEITALENPFKVGDKSQGVKDFQVELLRRGIDIAPDGSYGPGTQAAWDEYSNRRASGEDITVWSGSNPTKSEINSELKALAKKYDIPEKSLQTLIQQESSYKQFDSNGAPLLPPFSSGSSSAVGLGQITARTAGYDKNSFDYQKLAQDWKYNLDSAVNIFDQGYDHNYSTQFKDTRSRSGRAYGIYHDGFKPYGGDATVDSKYEKQYLKRYDKK